MIEISFTQEAYTKEIEKKHISCVPFFFSGVPLEKKDAPFCFLSHLDCGNMKLSYKVNNANRKSFFCKMKKMIGQKSFIDVELGHTKEVLFVNEKKDFPQRKKMIVDGTYTLQKNFVPIVTVADCVPIYFFDTKTKVFGIVHSGWKGTGIIKNAIDSVCRAFDTQAKNFCVVIGPCIHKECYIVQKDRAIIFQKEYGNSCVFPYQKEDVWHNMWNDTKESKDLYSLSLPAANIKMLQDIGVPKDNVAVAKECTSCSCNVLASFRKQKLFSPQAAAMIMAAFVCWL